MTTRNVTVLLFVFAIVITSLVSGGHSQAQIELTMRVRVFDPKFNSPKHGKGVTVDSTLAFRHGKPIRSVSGGEVSLPGFDEPQSWGTIIDADAQLQKDGTALINVKVQTSKLYAPKHQQDVHLVDGQMIHVSCPVALGKLRTIQCSDGRSLEILLEHAK